TANHVREGHHINLAPLRLALCLEFSHLLSGALQLHGRREQEVRVAAGKLTALTGTSRVKDRWIKFRAGVAVDAFGLKVLAIPIEATVVVPDLLDQIEPLLCIAIA